MKKNHNKLYYFIVIALMILGLTSCSSFNDSSINQNYIYTDESIPLCGDISESEKNILNEYLSAIYIENEDNAGFVLENERVYDNFKKMYSSLIINSIINSENPEEFMQTFYSAYKLKKIELNYNPISARDYFYYVLIQNELGEKIDYDFLYHKLDEYIDDGTGLIYPMSKTDDVVTKLIITGEILNLAEKNKINLGKYKFYDKIITIYNDFEFLEPEEGRSFYDSGAAVLYALKNSPDINRYCQSLSEWFLKWDDKYSDFMINTYWDVIEYESFCNIAELFGKDYNNKITSFIKSESLNEMLSNTEDFVVSDIYENIIRDYSKFCSDDFIINLNNINQNFIDQYVVRNENPDYNLGELYFGMSLSEICDFEYNQKLVSRTFENIYNEITAECSDRDYILNTYYYMMYKYSNFTEDHQFDRKTIEKRLDKAIDGIVSEETINLNILRIALEVKSHTSETISASIKNKVSELLIDDFGKMNSTEDVVNAIKIDYILKLNLFDTDCIKDKLNTVYLDGGYICGENELPDLRSTFLVYSFITNHNFFFPSEEELNDLHDFVELLNRDGLYRYEINYNQCDTRSIYYGYILSMYSKGGNNGRNKAL